MRDPELFLCGGFLVPLRGCPCSFTLLAASNSGIFEGGREHEGRALRGQAIQGLPRVAGRLPKYT
ncbi:hypothetical protein PF002_g13401 [Phytophthora fragariae]|uniref:Uncharacterized protein n=1 Tax=Phytophthora fragariae TaxID=53985 RepID=A0A6A3Z667_9STRA|nr:hypothetical protein PF002_g13401 [Phytophthora fragariae]